MLSELANNDKYLHEQFYSSVQLGEVMKLSLRNLLSQARSISVVDLCMGEGALLKSVSSGIKNCILYGSDIDINNVNAVRQDKSINVRSYNIDATKEIVSNYFKTSYFDLVVGNPPFKLIRNTGFVKSVCSRVNIYPDGLNIEAEVYFLIYGLSLLKRNGVLAYIIPDGVLNKNSLSPLREYLVNNYSIERVVELKQKSFGGTEARTHLIVIKNKPQKGNEITISSYCGKEIYISKEKFINRADFSYHNRVFSINRKDLRSLGVEVFRGRRSKVELEALGIFNFIHTSTISHEGTNLKSGSKVDDKVVASSGDIVIARVGSRCIGKFGYVDEGEFYITDCIIIIRAKSIMVRNKILKTLSSDFGRNWLSAASKGVGARHITVKELYNLPIV